MILAIALLGLGLAFIVAEVLFPSFGLLSICATISIVAAVLMAFGESNAAGLNFLVATCVLVPVTILAGFKLLPKSPMGRHFILPGFSYEDAAATDRRDAELLGEEGDLEADCRPAGVARFAGRRVDVVSRGEPIGKGARVRVLEVRGNRVVVGRVPQASQEASV
ncbi:MAG: NfeD family protein [Planctomycetota bacterium]